MDIIVGGPLKPNGQNVPTRVGEIVSDYSELANIPNPRVGMEVWVASKKEAVRILTLKEATIAGVVVPNAVVDTWEVVPNRAMTTSLANKISEEEQRAMLAENALRDKVADLEENYIAHISEFNTEVESLHSEDAELRSNINEIQLDLQSQINELGQEYLKGIEDVNRGITRIDAKAIQIGSFEVESLTDGIGVNFSNIDGTQSDSFEIPAATSEKAGVMTAEDKKIVNGIDAAIEEGEKRALRKLFIAAGALYNDTGADIIRTAPWGESVTHKDGHYYLNGLGDITEEQMGLMYIQKDIIYNLDCPRIAQSCKIRTIFPLKNPLTAQILGERKLKGTESFRGSSLEVLVWHMYSADSVYSALPISGMHNTFYNCSKLKIIGLLNVGELSEFYNPFVGCISLEQIGLYHLNKDVSFCDSPLLKKECVVSIISDSQPSSAITITLHPDAYARLADDVDIVAALEAQPLVTLVSA